MIVNHVLKLLLLWFSDTVSTCRATLRLTTRPCHGGAWSAPIACTLLQLTKQPLPRRDYRGNGRTGAVCGADEAGVACVMRDGGKPAPPSASCVLVDDQFAYIPRDLADTFFRTDAAPTTAFKGPNVKAANKGKLHYVRMCLQPFQQLSEQSA